jgi:type I restriction enzyme S subunit
MKKGWEMKKLGEVCKVVNGGTPKTGVPEYWDGRHRWITPAEMGKRLSPYISETERMISDLGLRNSSAQLLPPNSVILSSRAPIGHLVINTEPMGTNQGCKGLIPRSQIEAKFLYHFLSSIVDLLNSLGTGATFKELSGGKLKEVTIPIPPLPEQRRIVAVLDEAFAGLATAKANAETNLQNARALFESHLQSVFSQKGEGWVEKTLGESFKTATGTTPPKGNASYYGDFMPFVKPPELCDSLLDSAMDNLSEAGSSVARTLPEKSILVSCIGNLGKIGLNTVPVAFNQQINAILPDETKAIPELMFYQALSSSFKGQLQSLAGGTTVPIVNKSKFNSVTIFLPPLHQQMTIVSQLDALSTETTRLAAIYQQKLAALEALKKSLLHQAFTGQL